MCACVCVLHVYTFIQYLSATYNIFLVCLKQTKKNMPRTRIVLLRCTKQKLIELTHSIQISYSIYVYQADRQTLVEC